MNMLFFHGVYVARGQYNVKLYGIHEIILLDTCLLRLYLPPDWLGQYFVTYHNNETHIASAVDHDVQR